MSYLYETHLHTSPVSKCAGAMAAESLAFYKSLGYAGVFITNHFIDGNINCSHSLSYEERISFYFSDYEAALPIARELGIAVFCGVESSYGGTDFLIYGLDKAWFLAHPEIESMKRSDMLSLMMECGALIVQAHPYREASYIDHIRLFPRHVHGVEIFNSSMRDPSVNDIAKIYAEHYGLLPFAGSDNHTASKRMLLGGMMSDLPIEDEQDFVRRVKAGEMTPFCLDREQAGQTTEEMLRKILL